MIVWNLHLTISLPAADAHPIDLGEADVEVFREDSHQARTDNGPAVMDGPLRNTSIGYHRTNGDINIARATRRANRCPTTSSPPRPAATPQCN
jgi:hypothetical protein